MNSPPITQDSFRIPNCLILPSKTGTTTNCTQVPLPSVSTIILVLIISWVLYLAVAYAIYYFVNKYNPNVKLNYWIILVILILSGLIVSLFY
ncbi:hypothetical protein QJ856_gp0271 [Tupanvirus deep ocean]|uniref:Uncharacterized protein n=2 Tax=Tupanvirus TaxID=2094720 RepID=A0AC62A9K5_9VIRU|nr:hypothetical protein QJ856_gp0271 [Tupanvirus deep ocean]QKU34462.1 hypothetical protein [Tupanvirus deep ocean]